MFGLSGCKSTLLYTAAFLNLAIIPKHCIVGATKVKSAVDAIPDVPEHYFAKSVIRATWDLTAAHAATFCLLNYKWAKYGTPTTIEDKLMLAVNIVGYLYTGYHYFNVPMYLALMPLWVSPAAAAIAWWL
ncbi:hypothetical protein FOYG_16954 [Fusarium oxysporum NRRL 32931]|uniref:Uncharacterized protein n=1 Tax=Fusarium oxysporum NRRL 32931 TaxID=660029 RepID=W9HFV8_FUSOX|nr:hypothetical protein FOYG_16954 [Fusarium oxysporum NRRL 32931]